MRIIALTAAVVTSIWAGAVCTPAQAAPQRIVSMNLCTDQLVLLLVPHERIASISFLGADPAESPMADLAKGIPINHGAAEEVIALKPDLVLTGRFTTGFAKAMLRRLGFPVIETEVPHTIAEVRDVTRAVGAGVEEPARAEALLAEMDARLARIAERAAGHARYPALTYDANGFTVGRPTVTDEIMALAGLDNMAPGLGIAEYGNLPLERLLIARPQRILHLIYRPGVPSLAEAYLQHPALRARLAKSPMITVEGSLLNCATPEIATAAEQIAAEVERAP